MSVVSPPSTAVGKWKLEFESLTSDGEHGVMAASQLAIAELYILFNAWCKGSSAILWF